MNYKKWCVLFCAAGVVLLILFGTFVAVVDPYFHYHAPGERMCFILDQERYQNDGIVRHFSYDAIITGTSMTENFRSSEFDTLFEVRSIKVPFSGGTFREINRNLMRAYTSENNIRYIVRSIDINHIAEDKDALQYDSYPDYLYDDCLLNDVNYLLNKDVGFAALEDVLCSLRGKTSTSFDDYANWMEASVFGKTVLLGTNELPPKATEQVFFSPEDQAMVEANLTQNVIELAQDHPETEFYLFFPPYSILWWDAQSRDGMLNRYLDILEYTSKRLLETENIHLFAFYSAFDVITNLEYYKDSMHYSESINSLMLKWMRDGRYELTKANLDASFREARSFFLTYDYESIYE